MVTDDLLMLRKMYTGFLASRVVITANNLDVFEKLRKPVSAAQLAKRLNTDERATEILLDALTGIELVRKSKAGLYRNLPVSTRYLLRKSPEYQGDIIRHASTMWENWSALDQVMITGRPAHRAVDHEAFILGMHNLSVLRTESLLKSVSLKGVKTALDLGGGPGTNAIAFAHLGIATTHFDLPETAPIARRLARKSGAKGIRFKIGNFLVDDIGQGYDLVMISQIFHAFSEKENKKLLRKCRRAMNPGGRVLVQEFPINEARTAPPPAALFSVNMLVATRHGRCYTPREISGWLRETGFQKVSVKSLPETVLFEGKLPR